MAVPLVNFNDGIYALNAHYREIFNVKILPNIGIVIGRMGKTINLFYVALKDI